MTCQGQSGDRAGGTENRLGVGVGNPWPDAQRGSTHVLDERVWSSGEGLRPEQLCVLGADFTNSFCLLSSFPAAPESPDLDALLAALTAQCASLEELRLAFRPQMDPRWVLGSCFPGICFRKGRNI